ncbi:MAG: 30S ribosomal protein S12 methylthiotransferase RimO, partial [Pseudoflavonifractor sp.]
MMALCRAAGHTVVADPHGADVAVLNTCGFIDTAKSEAIDNILELADLKTQGQLQKLLVTGCLSQRYKDELMDDMPEVDGIPGTGSYTDIVPAIA